MISLTDIQAAFPELEEGRCEAILRLIERARMSGYDDGCRDQMGPEKCEAECDALRAKLAEAERERDVARGTWDLLRKSLLVAYERESEERARNVLVLGERNEARQQRDEALALCDGLREALERLSGWMNSEVDSSKWVPAVEVQHARAALALTPPQALADLRARLAGEFVLAVNARAEADMLAGNPVTGAHHRAIESELAAIRERAEKEKA